MAKYARKVKVSKRRRLQSDRNTNLDYAPLQPARNVVRGVIRGTRKIASATGAVKEVIKRKVYGKRSLRPGESRANFRNRLSNADSITNAPTFKIGRAIPLTFDEKVQRINNPPVVFKRNFQFNVEAISGRKAMFGIPINKITAGGLIYGDLYDDAISGYSRLTTETATSDPTILANQVRQHKVYVDYLSENLKMVNSSSNVCKGKVTLFCYKRDCETIYTNSSAPMTPINLMMWGSTGNLTNSGTSNEATVGNGWAFANTGTNTNYTANFDMPGSSQNSSGVAAYVDPELTVMSAHIKEFTGYYFKKVNGFDFTLKPGQQIDHWTIFNDLPNVLRQHQDMAYIKNLSYYLVVEFEGGIVGDSTAVTGVGVVSTGNTQLSCIVQEKRIIGLRGKAPTSRLVMLTPPLTNVAKAAQFLINPDTGTTQSAYVEDDQ